MRNVPSARFALATSQRTEQGQTVRIHGSCRVSRVKTLPRNLASTSAHTHALAHPANTASSDLLDKRFLRLPHTMAAQLLPSQLLELQRRPQAARRLGLTQARPHGSVRVPNGESNPPARATTHLSAPRPPRKMIQRGTAFFPPRPPPSSGVRAYRRARRALNVEIDADFMPSRRS